ncbi:hypothetical protein Tco_0547949 [Tanacetum coccineum]
MGNQDFHLSGYFRRIRGVTPPLPTSTEALIAEYSSAPTPPSPSPSPLSPLSSPLPRIPSPQLLLPSPTCRDMISEADMPPRKRARFAAPSYGFEIRESLAAAAARQLRHRQDIEEFYTRHQDAQDDRAAEIRVLQAETRVLQQQRRDDHDLWTGAIGCIQELEHARDPERHDGPTDAGSSC